MALPAASELRAYELEAQKQSRGVEECNLAIESFERQIKAYSDQLQEVANELEVPDATVVEIEQRILDSQQLALAFEEEAQDHEQQIVYFLDAVIAGLSSTTPGSRTVGDKRQIEQTRRQHEHLAKQRGERVTKRQTAVDHQQDSAQKLLAQRAKRRGGKPSPTKGGPRVAALKPWKRQPAPFKPTPIKKR